MSYYIKKQRRYGRGLWFIRILTSNYPWFRLKTSKVKPLCKNHQWVKSLQDTGLDWFESRVSGGAHTERTIAYYTIHRLYIPLPGIGNGAR